MVRYIKKQTKKKAKRFLVNQELDNRPLTDDCLDRLRDNADE